MPYPQDTMGAPPMGGDPAAMLGAMMGGQTPQPMGEPPPSGGGDSSNILREALAVIASYQEVEVDDEDLLEAEEIRSRIQRLLAKQQKERDGLLQGKFSPGALR